MTSRLARRGFAGKPQPAARAQIFLPWTLLWPLPTRLADFRPNLRDLVGNAFNAGGVGCCLTQTAVCSWRG
jgi:hypothetical protein